MNAELAPVLIAVVSVGVSLAALILHGQRAATADRQAIRQELRQELQDVRQELQGVRQDLHALGERVARLEGAFPFLARVEVPPASSPPAA